MAVIAIAAGGTAGHINPALALAQELAARGHEVRFFGTERGMEARLVPQEGFAFEGLDLSGIDRARPWTAVTALAKMRSARKRLLGEFSCQGAPGVAVGFGAYVAFPLAAAAAKLGVPLVLHEQNSVPGLANKALARKAALVALTYPSSRALFGRLGPSTEVLECGNPVRREITSATREQARSELGIPADATVLLAFGGSLGARHLNQAVARAKESLMAIEGLHVIHSTGAKLHDETLEALGLTDAEQERWHVMSYIDNMGSCLAAADVVLSRSGASSVAEIAARCVPSILVPYPLATANHQVTNAGLLVDVGGAVLVADDDLDGEGFTRELVDLLANAERRVRMRAALEELGHGRATQRLADAVEAMANRAQPAPKGPAVG